MSNPSKAPLARGFPFPVQDTDPLYPDVTLHDLRHTAASLAISAGANVKAVHHMLGHASAAMTLDVDADDLDHVATKLDAAAANLVSKMWPRGRAAQ